MKEGGYIPGGTMKNKQYLEKVVSFSESMDEMEQLLYYDAQTSGGLFIAVHPEQAEDMMNELQEKDVRYAQVVGEVIQQEIHSIQMKK